MAKVTITEKGGRIIEVSDMSIADVKELLSLNGNGSVNHTSSKRGDIRTRSLSFHSDKPDYASFKKALTEKASKFFQVLRENPNGITSEKLAEKLGFQSGSQIGGMAGGGITKIAARFGVDVSGLYKVTVKFGTNGRIVTYQAGPNITLVL